jgi:hypothetical protein
MNGRITRSQGSKSFASLPASPVKRPRKRPKVKSGQVEDPSRGDGSDALEIGVIVEPDAAGDNHEDTRIQSESRLSDF